MSTDLTEQLRSVAARFDELAPPVTEDELRTGAHSLAAAPTTAPRSSNVRFLAIAAAVAVLAGAVWLFSRPSDEPITSVVPASTTTHPTSSSTALSTALSTTIPAVDAAEAEWFTLNDDGYTPGATSTTPCCTTFLDPPGKPSVAAWKVAGNGQDGLLLVRRFPVTVNEQFVYTASYFRAQPDGSSWMFDGVGIDPAERNRLADEVTAGSTDPNIPFLLDDPAATPLALGTVNDGQMRAQVYASDNGAATLTVGTYGGELSRFIGGDVPRQVTVAGLPGYAATLDDTNAYVVWKMRDDLWGTLLVPQASETEMDDLIASLTPAAPPAADTTPLAHPEIPGQVRGTATVIQVNGGPAMLAWSLRESYPPQGGDIPLVGWNWDDVQGETTSGPVTWGGLYEVTGTWDGTTLTLTQPPRQGIPGLFPPYGFITPGCDETSFAPERQQLEDAGRALDHQFSVNIDQTNGDCGYEIQATVASPELQALLDQYTDRIVRVNYLLTAVN